MTAELAPVPDRKDPADRPPSRRTADRVAFRLDVPPVSGVLRPRLVAVCLVLTPASPFWRSAWRRRSGTSPSLTDVMRALVGAGDPAPS
ncbi:hypothetical protein WKI71_01860 [Streptomyces sp. MS1.AVA.1]|uniref:Uncharacterized protein n=1 Tax=Streptomyces machairae TaxID=3134109 RepID=A0ABU8UHE1_9ACTN